MQTSWVFAQQVTYEISYGQLCTLLKLPFGSKVIIIPTILGYTPITFTPTHKMSGAQFHVVYIMGS